jgi:hypothetical protein
MNRLLRAARAAILAVAACAAGAAPTARAQETVPWKSLDEVLKGRITAFDGREVEVHYDLVDAIQLEDFSDFKPFEGQGKFVREWYDRSIHLAGTGGIVWKPGLRRKAGMEFDAKMAILRDFGAYLAEARATEHFLMYSVYDLFFQKKDNPGNGKSHMICRFLPEASDSGGELAFRYVSRSVSPEIEARKPFHVRLALEGSDASMEIQGDKLQGKDGWGPALRGLRPGFYVLDSEAWVSSLVFRGEVDPEWAKDARVDLKKPVAIKRPGSKPGERTPNEADLAAKAKVERVRSGEDPPVGLLRIIEDAAILESVREDAAKAVEEKGEMKIVPRLVPLLESADPLARKLGGRLVTRIAGRSFGFNAEGPEAERRKAVKSLMDWIDKNPAKFL